MALSIAVDEEFGPWTLWLRMAASSPHLEVLTLTVDVAIESEQLGSSFPSDPADCLIVATARVHDLTLITSDVAEPSARAVQSERFGEQDSHPLRRYSHCSVRAD